MKKEVCPLYIFSLPRSGSTLLQRILTAHQNISTSPETWFLLPIMYMFRDSGVKAEFGYSKFRKGFKEFKDVVDSSNSNYKRNLKNFVVNTYTNASDMDAKYFLDKTPRYSIIADEIIDNISNAKFIFLWRNPLSIASSMIESWGNGKWNLYKYQIDLYSGMNNLIRTYKNNKGSDNILSINYEDLVLHPRNTLEKIFYFLDLEFEESIFNDFKNINFKGKMGDQVGTMKYSSISKDSLNNWVKTFNTPIRKAWVKKYLNTLNENDLDLIGYKKSNIIDRLFSTRSIINRYMFSDLFYISIGYYRNKIINKLLKN